MPQLMAEIEAFLRREASAVLVQVTAIKGSTPRGTDAFMLISPDRLLGTIGGGQLEYLAIDHARALLQQQDLGNTLDIPLGPEIGQCCGGRVALSFANITPAIAHDLLARLRAEESDYPDVMLFGAGHVGLALAQALAPLPFHVTMVETRAETLGHLPPFITARHVAMPETAVSSVRPGGAVVILTHDHALDFLIALEALKRDDLAYTGMIGSATKRATFKSWLQREAGDAALIDRLTLPIGGTRIRDKRPEVIAALVAAELLECLL